jgi:hypothetical protein
MNDDLVFIKTPSGEDAVRDRTRLVQRNLRMVLILVDGLTKVSALKQKAGDPSMIETALAELERIGLIESTESRGAKQASAVAEALSITDDVVTIVPEDSFHEVPTVDTVFEEFSSVSTSLPIRASDDAVVGVPSVQAISRPDSQSGDKSDSWISRLQKRWHHVQEERTYERAYGKRRTEDDYVEPAPSKQFFGRRRFKLKPVLSLILLAGILIGVARLFLYPYDNYRPGLEAELTKVLGEAVSIERVNLEFSPLPVLVLRGVAAGDKQDAVAEQISLEPNLGYLLGGHFVQKAKVTGLHLDESALGKLDKWLLRENMLTSPVEQVAVENLSVDLGWARLQGLTGLLRPRGSNDLLFAGRFGDQKSDGQFAVTPTASGLKISLQSGAWSIPIEPPMNIDALDFLGRLEKGRLTVEKMDMRAFDGIVGGTGLVTWGNNASIALDLALKHVSANKLLDALHAPALIEGELAGQVQYTNNKLTHKWMAPDAKAVATVSVLRGSLKRIDLAGAMKAAAQQVYSFRGGDTRFEDLAAKVMFEAGTATRVSDVHLSSGRLGATGQAVFPSDSGAVKGIANVEMRGSARAPRATINISGSSRDPELRVGPGYRPAPEPRAQETPGDSPQ